MKSYDKKIIYYSILKLYNTFWLYANLCQLKNKFKQKTTFKKYSIMRVKLIIYYLKTSNFIILNLSFTVEQTMTLKIAFNRQ